MLNKNNEELLDLNEVFKNNIRINTHAETKSYYALVLLGLLSVPLFTLLVEMLNLKLFDFWYNKLLFVLSLILLLLSLFSLLYSFIPRLANKIKKKSKSVVQISNDFNNDYYHYRFWANIKCVELSEIEEFLQNLNIKIIGSISLINQIINIAWIAKIKFIAFNISIVLQMLLIIFMIILAVILVLT